MDKVMKWYEKAGAESDVVCSTRIRLARNLKDYPFAAKNTIAQKKEIAEKVKEAVLSGSSLMKDTFSAIPLENMKQEELVSLVERHVVSPEFISNIEGREIILSHDESISIMVNEEDHIRIQVIREGLALHEAYEMADKIDTLLSERLTFAFDDQLGYLTHCPTNLGTGMRASLMLHLPVLTEFGAMQRLSGNLSKLGITIRGSYGEGTQVTGGMYQLSNRITLGLSEKEAIENLQSIANQLITEERNLRGKAADNLMMQDKISRSAGILKSAKMISNQECLNCLSYVRMGVAANLLTGINIEDVNDLWVSVQPATLLTKIGKDLTSQERDIERAKIVRSKCENVKE
ncbi:protein arginine kinase [Scatolibacter rhodanostii]|uniref:protein arginine kinase n=1 Tax=Scatolibacter rhodanostii TaxID=2014781 RepID=UPI001FA934D0|nr:protein arginine kinase [Scatolibacter rhodanostii]